MSGCSSAYLDVDNLESCPDHHGYDYFKGSELSFIVLWTCFGVIPFGKSSIIHDEFENINATILFKEMKQNMLENKKRISWVFFHLVCILSAYAAAKCRKWKHSNEVRKMQTKTAKRDSRNSVSGINRYNYQYF